jgi:serine/threonine protein kinase/Tfp pilus assembly protein PilF
MNESPAAEAASQDALVGRVVDEFLEALGRGERPAVADYAARHPEAAGVLREVLTALQFVRAAGPPSEGVEPAAAVVGPARGTLGDFRLLREVGRGGMGVVYEAEQLSLGRRVALKVLPFAATLDARQLQRFHNEAQAAAHLQHQHIVPVYFVGQERGVHYYAMQFIDGQTLAAFIKDLRRLTRPDPGPEAPAPPSAAPDADTPPPARQASTEPSPHSPAHFRAVARLGAQAAEALEHAHQLGVIHRDVKPANLLVDRRGNLWVTDFGLAQVQSQPGLTLTGDLVGTLRYMSPEQASGRRVLLDHRTDVYSLGATLYELLTLEPAFPSQDRQELLRQITSEEPRPPRRLSRAVPAELETILLKALEKDPGDRYATAQELADDLGRFLKDEPIRARRPTWFQRLRKWGRRNRAVVWSAGVSAVALLLIAVVALTLGLLAVGREQGRTQAALDLEAKRRQQWRRSLDAMSSEVIDGWLARQQVLLPEHRKFLESALEMYEEFARDSGQDEQARAGVARAYFRVGSIRYRLGQRAEAEAALKHSQELFRRLAGDFPGVPDYQDLLASTHTNLGILLSSAGRARQAEAEYRAALTLHKQLADEFPGVPEYPGKLAATHTNLGALLHDTGRSREGEGHYRAALTLHNRLADEFPGVQDYRKGLAISHTNLGVLLRDTGRARQAEAEYRAALTLHKRLADEFPGVPDHRGRLAATHINLGALLLAAGRVREAEGEYRAALTLCKQLAADFPSTPGYRQRLAGSHNGLGRLLEGTGRAHEAEQEYRAALTLCKQLAADFPGVPDYSKTLATGRSNLGILLRNTGRVREAETEYREAVSLLRRLAADLRAVPEYRQRLATARNSLGVLLAGTGRTREAEAEYRAALSLYKKLAADLPAALECRAGLANSHNSLGLLLKDTGQTKEAEQEYRTALSLYKRLAADFPANVDYLQRQAGSHTNLGDLLSTTGRAREAEAEYRAALALGKRLAADLPTIPEYRAGLATTRYSLGVLLAGTGRAGEAEAEYRAALTLRKQLADDFPGVPGYRARLADSRRDLGNLLASTRRAREAEAEYRAALALGKRLAADVPAVPEYRAGLASTQINLGVLLVKAKRADEAEEQYRAALVLNKQLAKEFPAVADYQSRLGACLNNLAMLLMHKAGQLPQARHLLERAVRHQRQALRANARHPAYRQFLHNHYANLARVLVRLGEHAAAAQAAEDLAGLFPERAAAACRAYACLRLCMVVAGKDARLSEAQRQAAACAYARRARRLLEDTGRRTANDPRTQNELAGFLADNRHPSFRDPALAVELARRAVRAAPGEGKYWNTLGVAHYRAGDWKSAVAALDKAMALRKGGDGPDWFFLAMAHWRLGHRQDARQWYARAEKWAAEHAPQNDDLRRLRAEAAALIQADGKHK